jgi:predicted RNA-binding Zn ribbon-like protein
MKLKMEEAKSRVFDLTLTGQLSLDFVNTVDWRTSEQPEELLKSYSDLVRWSQHTGLLTATQARHISREATRHSAEADGVLDRAKDLRETLFRIFSAIAAGRKPAKADLELLNAKLREALSHLRLAPTADGCDWEWADAEDRLDRMLWAVARATGELLTDADGRAQLRECANEGCGWLFVDTSRNKSRRWCSMGVCGNRVKARRHYERVKSKR